MHGEDDVTEPVRFLLCQLVGLASALLFRRYLRPAVAGAAARHLALTALGVLLLHVCYGEQARHLLAQAALTFAAIRLAPAHSVHIVCLLVAMAYLSLIHIQQLVTPRRDVHISGPVMVSTMKVTLLAFNIHDGSPFCKLDLEAKPELRRLAIRRLPSLVEFLGFFFNFPTLFAGPMLDFRTYLDFIEQGPCSVQIPAQSTGGAPRLMTPDPVPAVTRKMAAAVFFALCIAILVPRFPLSFIGAEEYQRWWWPLRWGYVLLVCALVRSKYYTVWLMADANCNASGLGFNGLTLEGRQRWNAVSNVFVSKVEWGVNFREVLEGWNVHTHRWLRLVVYERTRRHRTALVYALSAVWHGFHPVYYLTFATGALCTQAGRTAHRCLWPRVQHVPWLCPWYELAGRLATHLCVVYIELPFALLDLRMALVVYRSFYFVVHIACVVMILLVPKLFPPLRKPVPVDLTSDAAAHCETATGWPTNGGNAVDPQANGSASLRLRVNGEVSTNIFANQSLSADVAASHYFSTDASSNRCSGRDFTRGERELGGREPAGGITRRL
ncbi:lysophospholipid acyltransferase 1-like [Pollicipes pollicipes]|uniref:lysophospholipid acyltransferase 1-like n=1 Tax=Pollicipes pollicipes TaxID=41117 RepID=UPI0018852298|nr:lysophospholipid acyltransferase 1-like [Pollicipes pollicipes]